MTGIVHIDTRWRGNHGIGRYAHEVLSRLSVDVAPLQLDGSPSSMGDAFRSRGVPRSVWCYSPGFNAQLGRPRQILTVHDLIHLELPSPKRSLYRAYYNTVTRPAIRAARTVFTVSRTSADRLERWIDDAHVDILVTGCGTSPAFHPDPAQPRAGFVCVTNLRPHKNLGTLLGALTLVPELTGVVVVPPSEAAATRELIASRGLGDRVEIKSGLTDEQLAALYRGASFSVFPSLLEGFGLPALESIRCGTPVVYWSGCASVAELVGGNGRGVLSATSAAEWADALRATTSVPTVDQSGVADYSWDTTASVVSRALAMVDA